MDAVTFGIFLAQEVAMLLTKLLEGYLKTGLSGITD